MSRPRERILANLEALYRESFSRASDAGDQAAMQRLDFEFRRDQLYFEIILDVRDRLAAPGGPVGPAARPAEEPGLGEHLDDLRKLTRFPFGR